MHSLIFILLCITGSNGDGWEVDGVRSEMRDSKPESSAGALSNPWPEEVPDFIRESVLESKRAGKPIFVDFSAKWCGPCKLMERQVFPDPKVKAELENWIVLRIDTDRYPHVAKAFSVTGIPVYLLLSEKGIVLDKLTGYQIAEDFLDWLFEARKKER